MNDEQFAHDFRAGVATDSLGNRIDATKHSLLGPQPPVMRDVPSTTGHMTSPVGVENAIDEPRNPIESDEYQELLHPGFLERRAQMYREACLREPSEQEKKEVVDRAVILAAFRQGYAR